MTKRKIIEMTITKDSCAYMPDIREILHRNFQDNGIKLDIPLVDFCTTTGLELTHWAERILSERDALLREVAGLRSAKELFSGMDDIAPIAARLDVYLKDNLRGEPSFYGKFKHNGETLMATDLAIVLSRLHRVKEILQLAHAAQPAAGGSDEKN